ncbi:Hypothetical protein LEPBI_I1617 [Leptospira biflexa serovar Patoc strain 'Patoc 1 (Paris)']|uniref:Uncharacterized protein n=1 Tax=Leptospira biflexa serovar Patoc (strain Patoc 1 / ATCC 23582 / Paris) TaxID=456481 RepID=B0SR23_LEPBP|nr:Hypothetical protein LEPBI_I1617 [Leptospira biflexa serovar Patoc strain 'Patoc 1 (Paris)']
MFDWESPRESLRSSAILAFRSQPVLLVTERLPAFGKNASRSIHPWPYSQLRLRLLLSLRGGATRC